MIRSSSVTRSDIAEIYEGLAKRATSLDDVAKFEQRALDVRANDQVISPDMADHIVRTRAARAGTGREELRFREAQRKAKEHAARKRQKDGEA